MKQLGLALALALCAMGTASAQELSASIHPALPHVEMVRAGQALNFDVVVRNVGTQALTLTAMRVSYADASGRVLLTRNADTSGSMPALTPLGSLEIAPGGERLFINPFPVAPADLAIARARAHLTFSVGETEQTQEVEAMAGVSNAAPLVLAMPLRGRVLVWSAHDEMAHHRRFDYALPPLRAFGMVSNAGRYAYDLVIVDDQGRMSTGDDTVSETYLGFGMPVLAPVSGTVVEVRSDMPDNGEWNPQTLPTDPNVLFGNHIVIEAQPGVFVVLAHLKQGSPTVHEGERIREGQQLANIGHSGSSLFPHLHVQVMDGRDSHAEGLPSVFENYERLIGDRAVRVRRGPLETGDIVRAR